MKKAAVKADDDANDSRPVGPKGLAYAVMLQGVDDIMKGDPGAINWLGSRDFEHWCAWLDIDTEAAREAINQRRARTRPKWPEEMMRRACEMHRRGTSWDECAWRVFSSRSAILLMRLKEYDLLHMPAPSRTRWGFGREK